MLKIHQVFKAVVQADSIMVKVMQSKFPRIATIDVESYSLFNLFHE